MRIPRVSAFLGVALVLAGAAAAHGVPLTKSQSAGAYDVTLHTYDFVTQREWVRLGFDIVDRSTGERTTEATASVFVRFYDAAGSLLAEEEKALNLSHEPAQTINLWIGAGDMLELVVPLDGSEAAFAQPILPAPKTYDFGTEDGNDSPPTGLIGAVVALAGAAAVVGRKRQ